MRFDPSLYYVLDLPTPRDPLELAVEAVSGGASMLQLRGKRTDASDLYSLALALKREPVCRDVPLIINDRLDVALAAGADGVHVGRGDLPFERVRALAPGLILGVSCYGDLDRARRAADAGASYLAFGAFHRSPSKPEAEVVPLSVLSEARQLGLPVVAIGGLALENVEGVLAAGADGVAVISAIQSAVSPRQAARRLRDVIERRGPARGAHEPGTGGTDV